MSSPLRIRRNATRSLACWLVFGLGLGAATDAAAQRAARAAAKGRQVQTVRPSKQGVATTPAPQPSIIGVIGGLLRWQLQRAVATPPAPQPAITRGQAAQARPAALQDAHYVGIRKAALDLMRTFPPEQHFFLGVGRSPARIIAFLKNLSHEGAPSSEDVTSLAATIPASGVKNGIPQQFLPEAFRHFDRFLPADVQRGERAVVLIDSISSGSSVNAIATALEAYYRHKGVQGKVIRSGFSAAQSKPGFRLFHGKSYPGALGQDAAEFGEHNLAAGARLEQLQPNPDHVSFRQELLARMHGDGELDQRLRSEFEGLLADARKRAEETARKAEGKAKRGTKRAATRRTTKTRPAASRAAGNRAGRATRAQAWHLRSPFQQGLGALDGQPLHLTRKGKTFAVLDPQQYEQLRTGTLELFKRVPPEPGVHYVGVGRTSSATVAFLEHLGASVSYIPLDGLKKDGNLSPELRKELQNHLARFIPAAAQQGKRIVLFQRSDTGQTLPVLGQLLTEALRTRGGQPAPEVSLVAYTPSGRRTKGVSSIDTRKLAHLEELQNPLAKVVALHDYHRVGMSEAIPGTQATVPRRNEYQQFAQRLLELMKRDPHLHEHLSQPAPAR